MNGLVEYILYPSDQQAIHFRVQLDAATDTTGDLNTAPEWARLENHQCSHCPLNTVDHPLCPLAHRIMPFVEKLSHLIFN